MSSQRQRKDDDIMDYLASIEAGLTAGQNFFLHTGLKWEISLMCCVSIFHIFLFTAAHFLDSPLLSW